MKSVKQLNVYRWCLDCGYENADKEKIENEFSENIWGGKLLFIAVMAAHPSCPYRGNLPVQGLFLRRSSIDRTGRLPRRYAPRNDSGCRYLVRSF